MRRRGAIVPLVGALALMAAPTLAQSPSAGAVDPEDVVAAAKARTAERTAVHTEWDGPTTGPTADPGVRLVYISCDEQNPLCHAYGQAQVDAGALIGWEVTVLDGKNTTAGRLAACEQALALDPDAISLEGDVASLQDCLGRAIEQGIPIVGLHGAGFPGPVPELGLFTNISADPYPLGRAVAEFVIAHSDGTGKAMILFDNLFDVARAKAEGMRDAFLECTTCTLLGYESSPLAEVTTRTPQLFTSYVQRYGADFQYVMDITDYYYDFAVPALEALGVPHDQVKLVGTDGSVPAYERIQNGVYEIATFPEPARLQGFQVVDEVNRALKGEPPSGYVPQLYAVTRDNIDLEGIPEGLYDPSNGYEEAYLRIWKGQ